jgi:4-amino-4-deoxy-L-arabinose transferase-like glycosyltransferase
VLAMRHSLWADEVFSLAMATGHSVEHPAEKAQPALGDFVESEGAISAEELRRYAEFSDPPAGVSRVVRAVNLSDTSPPLYYILLHLWTRIWGTSDVALRMFSILCALACVPLIYAIGREVESEKTGMIAAALFAVTPVSVYYASEGRMYSLMWLCLAGAAYATVKLHRGASGWRWELVWAATCAAGLLIHYYFVFPLAALGLFLLWRNGADRRWRVIARFAVVGFCVAPWYLQLPDSLSRWRITQDWVTMKPPGYDRILILRDLLAQYFTGYGHYLWTSQRILEMGALSVFAVAAGATFWRWRMQVFAGPKLMVWLWFLAAALGPLIADAGRGTYVAAYLRYSSAAMPAACLLGGLVLSSWRDLVTWGGIFLIGVCWVPSVAGIYLSRSRSGQQNADVAKHVAEYGGPGDLILVHSIPTGAIGLARYTRTPGAFATWVGQLGQRKVPESLLTLLAGRTHVYLVKIHTVGEPAPEEAWLRENANLVKEKQLGDAFITEFEPRGSERF